MGSSQTDQSQGIADKIPRSHGNHEMVVLDILKISEFIFWRFRKIEFSSCLETKEKIDAITVFLMVQSNGKYDRKPSQRFSANFWIRQKIVLIVSHIEIDLGGSINGILHKIIMVPVQSTRKNTGVKNWYSLTTECMKDRSTNSNYRSKHIFNRKGSDWNSAGKASHYVGLVCSRWIRF